MTIPVELRNQIYALVLGPPTIVHVRKSAKSHNDNYYFVVCSQGAIAGSNAQCRECWTVSESGLEREQRGLDVALSMVSRKISLELAAFMFSRNEFVFFGRRYLDAFIKSAPKDAKAIQHLIFNDILYDDRDMGSQGPLNNRLLCKALAGLKSLTINGQFFVRRGGEDVRPVPEDGILNYFQPFARLPLLEATVNIQPEPRDRRTTPAMLQTLNTKARNTILLDPSLPEQNVKWPTDAEEAAWDGLAKASARKPKKFVSITQYHQKGQCTDSLQVYKRDMFVAGLK